MITEPPRSAGAGVALSEEDCRLILRSHTLGRVALVRDALPWIVPVEYVYDDATILFRTESDEKLQAATSGNVLAFEVDAYDPESGDMTSVHVLGRTSVFTRLTDPPRAAPHEYVRLHCEVVSGRRVRSTIL
jgi:nitroimidazol reductase NimA-like FMN-containing flavoprotein (pyridoxamine 5'-phosphate oxidase superfamily)